MVKLYEYFYELNPKKAKHYQAARKYYKKGLLDSVVEKGGVMYIKDLNLFKEEMYKISQGKIKL